MMNKRILFVVHRYGYPGGSEQNTKTMAEECSHRGYDTWVLTDEHMGEQNGVKVSTDMSIAYNEDWNLIVVHGSCPTQDRIHVTKPKSKVLYLLIQPSDHPIAIRGMENADYIGCGTSFDWAHVKKHGMESKSVDFVYGIPNDSLGRPGFRQNFGITTKNLYISAGGFWPHKRMIQLENAFIRANVPDTTLVLMGYDSRHGQIPHNDKNVLVLFGTAREHVLSAMAESDLYISNSEAEGYGLVLLEAMYNKCPWLSTDVAAAHDLAAHGTIFNGEDELIYHMQHWAPTPFIQNDYEFVRDNHMAKNSVDSLEKLL